MWGNGVAATGGVVYGVGVVEVLVVEVGGMGIGVSEVEGDKDAGFGVGNVGDVPEEGAPEEGAPEEGASRMLERGQCKPAMDASRLFSIKMYMLNVVIKDNTNSCGDEHGEAVRHVRNEVKFPRGQ